MEFVVNGIIIEEITTEEAESLCRMIRDYDEEGGPGALIPAGCYLWADKTGSGKDVWVAMYNEDHNAWVEEFNDRQSAIKWIIGEEV